MRFALYIFFLLLITSSAFAQTGTTDQLDSLNAEEKAAKIDSLKDEGNEKASNLNHRADSVKNTVSTPVNKVDSTVTAGSTAAKTKIDSIAQLPEQKVEEAKSKIDDKLNKGKQLEGDAKEKVNNTLNTENNLGNEELDKVTSSVEDKVPDSDQLNGKLDNVELPETDLPGEELTETVENGVGDISEVGELNDKIGEVEKLKDLPGEELSEIEGMEQIKEHAGKAKEVTGEISNYAEEGEEIISGNLSEAEALPETLESKALEMDEVTELQEQTKAFDDLKQEPEDYKAQLEKYQDKDFVKQEMKKKAMQLGTDHFAKHQDKLKAAQEQLSKYKKKYHSLQSTKDVDLKKIHNSMKGKKLKERIVYGGSFQVFSTPNTAIDLSPQVGYKISGKWSAGVSGTYRLSFKEDGYTPTREDEIYGYEINSKFTVYKGFFVKGELETLNVLIPRPTPTNQDEMTRIWVNGAFLGIGKQYNFIRGVKGNVQVMYNFLQGENSPYPKQFNMKFGFEFGTKKKKKKSKKKKDKPKSNKQ